MTARGGRLSRVSWGSVTTRARRHRAGLSLGSLSGIPTGRSLEVDPSRSVISNPANPELGSEQGVCSSLFSGRG
eukprot:7643197-Alexandrium_andersonii.AAC.1